MRLHNRRAVSGLASPLRCLSHSARVPGAAGHASGETYGGPAHNDQNLEPGMELYQSPGSDWCVRLWQIPEELALTGPVLVGDTIGTGTTLAGVLGWLVSKMKAAGTVQDIHIFTIAGAAEWAKGGASRSRSCSDDLRQPLPRRSGAEGVRGRRAGEDGGLLQKLAAVDEALGAEGKELTVSFCNARFALQGNGTDLNPAPAMGAEWVPEALEIVTAKVRSRPSTPSSVSSSPRSDPGHPSQPFRAPVAGAATSELLLHLRKRR